MISLALNSLIFLGCCGAACRHVFAFSVFPPFVSYTSEDDTIMSIPTSTSTTGNEEQSHHYHLSSMSRLMMPMTKEMVINHGEEEQVVPQEQIIDINWSQLIRVAAASGSLQRVQRLHQQGGSQIEHINDQDHNGWQV
jgi:hypothetical protein